MTRPTTPFFPRLGGKTKLASKIVKEFPKNYEDLKYVEVFTGGGSVFWKMKPSKIQSVLNDKNRDIYDLWRDMKSHGEKVADMDFSKCDRKYYESLKKQNNLSGAKRLFRNLSISKLSFGGMRTTFVAEKECQRRIGKNIGSRLKKRAVDYKEALKGVKIHNMDFRRVLKKYDSKNTFFYLDPPYSPKMEKSKWFYTDDKKSTLTPEDVLNSVKNLKGKFLISYNYSPKIKKLFSAYKVKTIKTTYTIQPTGSAGVRELLIKNY